MGTTGRAKWYYEESSSPVWDDPSLEESEEEPEQAEAASPGKMVGGPDFGKVSDVDAVTSSEKSAEGRARREPMPVPPPPIQDLRSALAQQMKRLDAAMEQGEETLARVYSHRFVAGEY